jgi:hypothetical protein
MESQPRGSDGEAAEIAAIEKNEEKLKSLLSERAEYQLLARQFATVFLAELERLRR